jgi:TetR/AcrR family transcriptional regulator, transcriptional repressor for nem operon
LVLARGFAGTSVDAILGEAQVSKGAFFHHFSTKASLGRALVERHARSDAEILDRHLAIGEAASTDPAEQLVAFLRSLEEAIDTTSASQPGCLFVSFVYETLPVETDIDALILDSIELWRQRILQKLEAAAERRPPVVTVDLESLADQVFTLFEGGFILARATDDPGRLRSQIAHLRTYLSLLFLPAQR